MLELLGIAVLLVFIGLSIALHEIGHMVPAKKFGVRVTDYAIGFGPTLFKRQRGETLYHIKLIPLGGFIRMIGMYPPAARPSTGRFAALINQAREVNASEISPGDERRTFYGLPVGKRLIIMTGGPLMNLGLAAVLFAIVFSVIGVAQASNAIGQIIACVPTANDPRGEGTIAGCVDGVETPAVRAGLSVGDTIVSINGVATKTYSEVSSQLQQHNIGDVVEITVQRGEQKRTVSVTLADAIFEEYDETGSPLGTYRHRPLVGFIPGTVLQPLAVSEVPGLMWEMSVNAGQSILAFPQKLWTLGYDLISGGQRDPNGPISVVGISRLSGQVVASDLAVPLKIQEVLGMAASLNLFLFLFNLLPLLPLDGGHVAAALFDGAKRGFARLRKLPTPAPVDVAKALPLTYVVAALLLLSGVLVIIADLVAPITYTY